MEFWFKIKLISVACTNTTMTDTIIPPENSELDTAVAPPPPKKQTSWELVECTGQENYKMNKAVSYEGEVTPIKLESWEQQRNTHYEEPKIPYGWGDRQPSHFK